MLCGHCGEEIPENDDFCKKCVESYKIDDKPIKNRENVTIFSIKNLNALHHSRNCYRL